MDLEDAASAREENRPQKQEKQPGDALTGSSKLVSGIMEKKMETTIVCRGYIGIMQKKMETTIVCRGYIGIMEKKMETSIVCRGYLGVMERRMDIYSMFIFLFQYPCITRSASLIP